MWTLGLNNTLARGFTVGVSALYAGAGVFMDAWTKQYACTRKTRRSVHAPCGKRPHTSKENSAVR